MIMNNLTTGNKHSWNYIHAETRRISQTGDCYEDAFNQMYILLSILSNTTINISTNTNFEQIMVDFSISSSQLWTRFWRNWTWLWTSPLIGKLTPKTDKGHWTIKGSTTSYDSKAKKIKIKNPVKNTAKQYQTGRGVISTTQNSAFWLEWRQPRRRLLSSPKPKLDVYCRGIYTIPLDILHNERP